MTQSKPTPDYDPRYDRAQTLDGAKARYTDHDTRYGILELERDIERILILGEYPDREQREVTRDTPIFEGQRAWS